MGTACLRTTPACLGATPKNAMPNHRSPSDDCSPINAPEYSEPTSVFEL